MSLAPIVLFVYNRPEHTRRTLESLMSNELSEKSELFVFADGPKENATFEQLTDIKKVRDIISKEKWCNSVTIFEGEKNKGLADSIIHGVTEIVNKYNKIIVLEDDLVTSKWFLKYMNDALNEYETNENVACISAYVYPIKKKLPETFFVKGADCWGWATWKRAWNIFEDDGNKLLNELMHSKLNDEFDFDNTYPYTKMLSDQIAGLNNSWAIRWYASAFLQNKYCLYTGKSLVQNIGIDGSGVHSGTSSKFNVDVATHSVEVKRIPVEQNESAYNLFKKYFLTLKPSFGLRVKRFIRKLLPA